MKSLYIALSFCFILFSCKNQETTNTVETPQEQEIAYASYGEKIDDKNVMSTQDMAAKFKTLKPGDTVDVKFRGKVNEVCQSKGCWMRIDLMDEEAMVKFKDYGFFMPLDIADQEVIMEGKAFVAEVSVDEQRHYAEDAGKNEDEILAITTPERTLSFTASGVLIPEQPATEE